jgi:hypothetical protein
MYGQESDANSIEIDKANIEGAITKIIAERQKLQSIIDNSTNKNDGSMIQEVSEKEEIIRQLTLENDNLKRDSDLRKEQAKELYGRYDSNYARSSFGYNPIKSWNQSSLMFVAFLMGFIGLILIGIKVTHFIPYPDLSFLKDTQQPKQNIPTKKMNSRY